MYDVFRSELCEACPKKTDLERLKMSTLQTWEIWLGERVAEDVKFEDTLSSLLQVLAVKRYDSEETPVKVSTLIDVYTTEKDWFDEDQRPTG